MKTAAIKRKLTGPRVLSCSLTVFLFLSGCSSFNKQFSYFNMLDEKKRTLSNKKAAEKFWASVRPVSTLADSHYRLGLHYQQSGEYEKAIGEFTKALGNDSSSCKAYNGIAMSYDALRRCEPAHAAYAQALQCAPDQAYVYNNYACSSLLCGDYGKGVELLQKAEQLAKNDTRIKNNLRIAQNIVFHESKSDYFGLGQMTIPPLPKKELPVAMSKVQIEVEAETVGQITPLAPSSAPPPPTSPVHPASVAIEVSNGNGTTGMAVRSADFLRGHGFKVQNITNAMHFRFQESVIFYREEYLQVAKELAAIIPGVQNLEQVETMAKSSVGVRVLLGRDLATLRFPENASSIAGSSDRQTPQLPTPTVADANITGYLL